MYEVRQRRALAIGRAVLVASDSSTGATIAKPILRSLSTELSAVVGGASAVADVAVVLEELVAVGRFHDGTALALAFSREVGKHALTSLERDALGGIDVVVASLASRCVELDVAATTGGAAPDSSDMASGADSMWQRLQILLERHDCEEVNFELTAIAARAALKINPIEALRME